MSANPDVPCFSFIHGHGARVNLASDQPCAKQKVSHCSSHLATKAETERARAIANQQRAFQRSAAGAEDREIAVKA
jgi:hypothetical protein